MRVVVLAALIAAVLHAGGWVLSKETARPPEVHNAIDYLSYSPYAPGQDPKDREDIPAAQMQRDLSVVASVAKGVRTYSVIDGVDALPAIAGRLGLNVMLGAWVGDTEERDEQELATAVQLAKQHRNVRSVLVGNEVMLRGERSVDEMISLIRDVKKQVRVPVSTGEIWYIWLESPQLVKAVDFIAVHILPYWEGVAAEDAVKYTLEKLDLLRATYPGKRIVLAEFGWPSQGYNNRAAVPGQLSEATIVRDFLVEAQRRGIEYNLVEAFDQVWKTNEGSVGAYWGIFNADRELKFPLTGLINDDAVYWKGALALALGLALTMLGLYRRRVTFAHALAFAVAANAMGAGLALAFAYPFDNYMNTGTTIMWSVSSALVVLITVIMLAKVHEIAEVMLGRTPRRLIRRPAVVPADVPAEVTDATVWPKVSIHIPAYREPAHMVIETLDSLAALDYPNFEAVVIVNNTPEAHYSAPVAARCRELGERFKFLNVTCSGFKAGALNIGLQHTAADAEVIAVIDADYVVERSWLRDLMPHFADPRVGLIQAPQDHRDGEQSPLKRMMNSEYAGFFDIGMVQRNEDDAIIQHGTMCMVRRSALEQVGGWGTETIVEDTELGLRLYEGGYQALYTNHRYGRGLLPDTFEAFKTQRFRWAYGAMQIVRKHWPHMLPKAITLTPVQKFHFVTGWSLWLADAFGALASILNLLWVPAILFVGMVIPTAPFTVPIVTAFVINVLHCVLLYSKRVNVPAKEIPGAAVAAMSVQLTVARAVFAGLVKDSLPFRRTDKGGNAKRGRENPARWETAIGILLLLAALALHLLNKEQIAEQSLFALTLAIQSLPFLAATMMVLVERYQNRVALWSKRRVRSTAPVAFGATAETN
jgi:exo-beta-1,3-glucanase (GH17 family)/cellulose synthase/poly-beta-1,6-N-acetylglucosamine synthase-like glycosyltransferase